MESIIGKGSIIIFLTGVRELDPVNTWNAGRQHCQKTLDTRLTLYSVFWRNIKHLVFTAFIKYCVPLLLVTLNGTNAIVQSVPEFY